jgi:hypothetical protein
MGWWMGPPSEERFIPILVSQLHWFNLKNCQILVSYGFLWFPMAYGFLWFLMVSSGF